ncbi:MAG: tetratricopeptide repeat-containing sulfotransferase family protein [Caulobacteraceae bacterium]
MSVADMAETSGPRTGTLEAALAHASKLLAASPDLAEHQAREILKVAPGDPRALLLLGVAKRRQGDAEGAAAVLAPLAKAQPRSAHAHCELGIALAQSGEARAAIAALRSAVALKRDLPEAWRTLGEQLSLIGEDQAADNAFAELIRASVKDPILMQAADALIEGKLAVAEHLLRGRLRGHPTDVAAMRMLAETGTRLGRYGDVEALLDQCLGLAPSFSPARYNLAIVLYRQQKAAEAIPHLERLLSEAPSDPNYRNLTGACLGLIGEYSRAIEIFETLLAEHPDQPKVWLSLGHALKTQGRREEAIAAYQRATALSPTLGEAYWSLANLKTAPFAPSETKAMEVALARENLPAEDRLHFHYALGKALEDAGDFSPSFEHYAKGAALRREELPYDADETTAQMERSRALFTDRFFAERAGGGSRDPAPIFIVGLPRSGSTLIEQILASHSAVEGTIELPEIPAIARDLGRRAKDEGSQYPGVLAGLSQGELTELGDRFIERAAVYRKLGRAFFIDKMPNNLHHVGLIQLILPQAKIIDARRHPMGACFSALKQHFARGQAFSYDLADLGRYYRDYVALMAHFDAILPGRILRVIYEDMVEDTEGEVRRLLDHCGLPFEDACLRFWETDRAIRTASSEQVRRPIFREGLDQWRNYEPWLGPLEKALGPALKGWRS